MLGAKAYILQSNTVPRFSQADEFIRLAKSVCGGIIMKKATSLILTIITIFSTTILGIQNTVIASATELKINSFIDNTICMIRENDINKEFVLESKNEASTFSTESIDNLSCDFQSCRLIVQAKKEIEELNSTNIASGFLDYYIIQFANETDTQKAFEYYSECDYVLSVSPDGVFYAEESYTEVGNSMIEYSEEIPSRLDSWGSYVTGTYAIKNHIKDNFEESQLADIRVAVIDSGVDWEHEFLQNRLIKTGFNASSAGITNSEYDNVYGHGTGVSSVIVDNTHTNVKIANYRVINDKGTTTTAAIASAILKASSDGATLINVSLSKAYATEAEYNLINDAVEKAYELNCLVVAAAGNDSCDIEYYNVIPASSEHVLTVSSSDTRNFPSSFSNSGKSVNVMAPGEKEPIAYPNNKYKITSGTSFSAPLTVAAASLLKTLYPNICANQIKVKLESTSTKCDLEGNTDMFGYGIIDVIEASGIYRAEMPSVNLKSKLVHSETKIVISVPDGCEVYYTLDQTYPTLENGILYTEPFSVSDDIVALHAVAIKKNCLASKCLSKIYRFSTVGTDDMFTINSNGVINSYLGDIKNLIIPNTINGITVTGLTEGLFSDSLLSGVSFPDTVKSLPKSLFYGNKTIQFVDGAGIENISDYVFYNCTNLYSVDFPNVKNIGEEAFYYTIQLNGINCPKCTYIGKTAFGNSSIRYANFPLAEVICFHAFIECNNLYKLNIPNVVELRKESYWDGAWQGGGYTFKEARIYDTINIEDVQEIPYGAFYQAQVTRLEFSNAKRVATLPITYCKKPFYGTMVAVLPSTMTECSLDSIPSGETESMYDIKYIIYGSEKTYAQQWATEQGFDFIKVTPETAIITDLPDEYYSYMRPLKADVIGFNRTYQWYGSNFPKYNKGIAIDGATEKEFNPNEHKQYKYYFCKVVSTDVGYEPIEIKTGICENKSYKYSSPTSNGKITIAPLSNRYIKYGESINLYANSIGLPEGSKIKWRIVDGSGVTLDASSSGNICTVTSKTNGNVIIEAYAVNKNGNIIVDENSNRICDREGISSEVNLWLIILHYIKQMFSVPNAVTDSLM